MGCCLNQKTRVESALDDMAIVICQALDDGGNDGEEDDKAKQEEGADGGDAGAGAEVGRCRLTAS